MPMPGLGGLCQVVLMIPCFAASSVRFPWKGVCYFLLSRQRRWSPSLIPRRVSERVIDASMISIPPFRFCPIGATMVGLNKLPNYYVLPHNPLTPNAAKPSALTDHPYVLLRRCPAQP